MIQADTSEWIGPFRLGDADLADLPGRGRVPGHDGVAGDLACSMIPRRGATHRLLPQRPQAHAAFPDGVQRIIDLHDVADSGTGYGDGIVWRRPC